MPETSMFQRWKSGEITTMDYLNYLAKRRGFDDISDYMRQRRAKNPERSREICRRSQYKTQGQHPMSENKTCSQYLGVHIAERILSKIFEKVTRMPFGNPGYDFICSRGFKIDVKSACVGLYNRWNFNIDKNNIADYFLFLVFDDRANLKPLHIWLIKGTEIVGVKNKYRLNTRKILHIWNTSESLAAYKKYEQTDKLEKLVACCDILKNKEE